MGKENMTINESPLMRYIKSVPRYDSKEQSVDKAAAAKLRQQRLLAKSKKYRAQAEEHQKESQKYQQQAEILGILALGPLAPFALLAGCNDKNEPLVNPDSTIPDAPKPDLLIPDTLKLDTSPCTPKLVWTQTYTGPANGDDEGRGIALDSAANVYVTGYTYVTGQSNDIWVNKYDTNGKPLWPKPITYNGPANGGDAGLGIAVDNATNVYVTGTTSVTGQYDIWVNKYDTNGKPLWPNPVTYNGSANGLDRGWGIAVDSAANVYVAGATSTSVTGGQWDTWINKYDTNGKPLWPNPVTYNGPANGDDDGTGIAVDNKGGIYVTGSSVAVTEQSLDIWINKYDANGNSVWPKPITYNGSANHLDGGTGIAVDNAANVYVTGSSEEVTGQYDIWINKYDANGNSVWPKPITYNGPGNKKDDGYGIAVDNKGGIYVIGNTFITGQSNDIWVNKYDSNGNSVWSKPVTYNGSANWDDGGYGIAVDNKGGIYVTGFTTGQDPNVWVGKYTDCTP